MRCSTTWLVLALGGLVLSGLAGCKQKRLKGQRAARASQAPARRVPVPKEVLAYVGLKSPGKTIDGALVLAKKFLPLPHTRKTVLDELARNARIPIGVMSTVDLARTSWLVKLDDAQVGTREASVVVFPIRSRKSFEAALALTMKPSETEGKLTLYVPKQVVGGAQPMRLLITDKHVYVASDNKSLALCHAFIRGNLLPATPAHDLAAQLMIANVMKSQGQELDRNLRSVVGQLKQTVTGGTGTVGKVSADTADKSLQRYITWLKSTHTLLIGLDMGPAGLELTLKARATAGGALHAVIKRQRVGPPLAAKLLPTSSWLVLSDHSNPGAVAESRAALKPMLQEALADFDPATRAALVQQLSIVASSFNGDYTLAAHRPPASDGMTLTAVGGMAHGAKARAAADKAVDQLGLWIKAEMKRRKEQMPQGFVFKRKALKLDKAGGQVMSLAYPAPEGKEKESAMVRSLLGNPFVVAWAFAGERVYVVAGQHAERQLKLLVAGKAGGAAGDKAALANKPDFAAAASAGQGRSGLLYLSLVDFVRWFSGSGNKDMEQIVAMLKGQQVKTAPSLSWGVNQQRTELDLTLRLPAEHFLTFKPVAERMMQGGLPAEMLPRGLLAR